jgi:hypothetical protein
MEFYLSLDGASFRLPDSNETALLGVEILLRDRIECVICAVSAI